jgi:GTP-binding protein
VKFIDEAAITAKSGDGGRGCVSFRREKFIPKGGPDGGDGGKGGDIIFHAVTGKRTLYQFRHQRHLRAENGMPGQGKEKTGKSGSDLVVDVPPGTIVTDADTGQVIKDFTTPGESFVILKGGRGGQGNARFKSSTNRAPRFAQTGEPGESRNLQLELKLLADVGIIGLPNAGKSTLISRISAARPKIADYPFTTLTPSLGVVRAGWGEPFVVADIPGLIEGAHAGAGLGVRFLKHVERTGILVHLVDAASTDENDPLASYRAINKELARYGGDLARKPQIVVLNKLDLSDAPAAADRFQEALGARKALRISAATGNGIDALLTAILEALDRGDGHRKKKVVRKRQKGGR